ncbi:hypothetical protein [Nitrosopumilus sp.]|uniref:capsular polysaccharide export protein, LipB/KpsS family n=1 Tax=Nitrosopumilus sp. TaxID=2024843 RepID=UPI00349FE5BA
MKDKILFWIDQTLVDYGTAKSLQENHDCDLFAIIDITDRTKLFFQSQKFVNFKKIWFYHDYFNINSKPDIDYLKSFEKKYDINLWLLAYNERIFYKFNDYFKFTEENVLSILEQECKLYEKIIDEINPNYVIMSQPPFHHNYLFYKICKVKKIKILILKPVRIGYKCIIANDDEMLDYKITKNISVNRTFDELLDYHTNFSLHKQGVEFEEKFQKSKSGFFKAVFQFLFISDNSNVKTHYTYYGRTKLRVLFKSILYQLKTKYRKNFINTNLPKKIEQHLPFVYFPLHIEQERSLLLLAPYYTNQSEVIKNIAQSLPVGYKLVLKEHPMMFARCWRSISDYKQIMEIPNIIFLHPSADHTQLLKNCSLVVTISGTSSFDAAIYQKPSILFVDTAFSTLPSVFRLKSLEDLHSVINQALNTQVQASDVNEYINFIEDISFDFDFDGFVQLFADYFYYGGSLVDTEISLDKMAKFLEQHKEKFELLSSEFIKKIENSKNL